MKTQRFLCLSILLNALLLLLPAQAQNYSPRRLTQRIAPQTTPTPGIVPPPAPAVPAVRVVQPQVDPEKAQAEKEEAARKAIEFRKQRAEEDAAGQSGSQTRNPLVIQCTKVQPDPNESLQFVSLSLSNTCSKAVSRITMHMVYIDRTGMRLKDWTTRRELDHPLDARKSIELNQPAYFMPLGTRQVKVEANEVRFSDGTVWVNSTN